MDGHNQNALKAAFGLEPISPIEQFYKSPCAETLSDIPKSVQTEEMVLLALNGETTQNPVLKNVAMRLLTQRICEEAVAHAVTNFIYVPDAYKTERMCFNVIAIPHEKYKAFSPYLLIRYVPEKHLSGPNGKELFKRAVHANKSALVYVPTEYITGELFEDSSSLNTNQGGNHVDELKAHFGFIQRDPLDEFFAHPCGELLSNISKKQQTMEMVTLALKEENEKCWKPILKFVARKLMTDEVCDIAVSSNVSNFYYVPDSFKTPERCLATVQMKAPRFTDAPLLSAVPEEVLMGPVGEEICEAAVAADWRSIKYVPKQYITPALLEKAVDGITPGEYIYDICDYFPQHKITKGMALEIMRKSGKGYSSLPPRFRKDENIIDAAIASQPSVVFDISSKILTNEMFYKAVQLDEGLLRQLPEYFALRFNLPAKEEFEGAQIEDIVATKVNPLVPEIRTIATVPLETTAGRAVERVSHGAPLTHNLVLNSEVPKTGSFYYISDIHIEFQLALEGMTPNAAKERIEGKVTELLEGVERGDDSILLIAGDVADCEDTAKIFYTALRAQYRGTIVFTLGNHELWDGSTYIWKAPRVKRSVDEIVASYKKLNLDRYNEEKLYCLENEVLVFYKDFPFPNSYDFGIGIRTGGMPRGGICVIPEDLILRSSREDLSEFLDESSVIILGGLGFCGLNQKYNADSGLFRNAITRDEEIERSERFRAVYDKVLLCAANKHVVVLTHAPISDWTNKPPQPGWVYVNGHTHKNYLLRTESGITVLSDNQVGYKPKGWHFNKFLLEKYYDPLEKLGNGLHRITHQQYMEFNLCKGISMEYFKQIGDVFVLKSQGVYMFFLKDSNSLYMLRGGHKLNTYHELDYYASHIDEYVNKINAAFKPYRDALKRISDEVKRFGGDGNIHGSIVDIDFFNHIYLSPYNGNILPYFAYDVTCPVDYKSVQELLKKSPHPPLDANGTPLLHHYKELLSNGEIVVLSPSSNRDELAVVSKSVLEPADIYSPSRVMRSIQYLMEQGVIRIWNDAILSDKRNNGLPSPKTEISKG